MKEEKKKLYKHVVYRICNNIYPSLLKTLKKDNELFLEEIPIFFDTLDNVVMDTSAYKISTEESARIKETYKATASFLPYSNVIFVHLEQVYEAITTIFADISNIQYIEKLMCSLITDNIIHELVHYHQFVDADFSDESKYKAECEVEAQTFILKLKYYKYLVNRLECIPTALFLGISDPSLLEEIANMRNRNDPENVIKITMRYMKEKNGDLGMAYMEYRKTDEFNLLSRYVYFSYTLRLLQQRHNGNGLVYECALENEDEILEIVSRIENCRGNVKYIKLYNDIDWNSLIANIGFPRINKCVEIPLLDSVEACKHISSFLNSLPIAIEIYLGEYSKDTKKIKSKKELFKMLHRDTIPMGYSLLVDLVKLEISVDDDVLNVVTVPLAVQKNEEKIQNLEESRYDK